MDDLTSKLQQHKKVYDLLSKEYEQRVKILTPITKDAMEWFSSYIKPRGKILDIGCAVGIAVKILSEKGFDVSGIEISPNMAKFAKQRNPKSNIITGDFLNTNFHKKFDAILAFAFIHLFPKKEIPVVLKKIKDSLKPNGVVLISTTESSISKEGWRIKKDYGIKEKRFRKLWTKKELSDTLGKNGFDILSIKKFTDPIGKKWMDFIIKNDF